MKSSQELKAGIMEECCLLAGSLVHGKLAFLDSSGPPFVGMTLPTVAELFHINHQSR